MKKISTIIIIIVFLFSCNKEKNIKTKRTKEDMILEFCKSDIHTNSITPSTIKYDSTLTNVAIIPKNTKYYNKLLNEIYESYGSKQILDTISKKWSVSLYYDSENKYGANIRNNVYYIIKENTKYHQDTIFNPQFIVLLKRDQNKFHEYLGVE
ncbi:hypothetical protein D0817_19960 [Flavobacterium cupreum]|uniref:Lipoprotein n=1 Tax=Flavobacterium cupreum TaxID=2133766 RepID=A0A434A2U0_9FLAO|nr:hypothetical protein [Flavobacterium]RUT68637.1 hypothetical protein D0817_19960 [Flavobacterium cupreum]TDO67721.1 hypothetical protein EV143_1305 [Flavobacterium sp. P3160]